MADPEQYVLSFDLSEITRNITELQSTYEALTKVVSRSSKEAEDGLNSIQTKTAGISQQLESSIKSLDLYATTLSTRLTSINSGFEAIAKQTSKISRTLKKLEKLDLSKAVSSAAGGQSTAAERISKIAPEADQGSAGGIAASPLAQAKKAQKLAKKSLKSANKAVAEAEKAATKVEKLSMRLSKVVKGEAKGARRALAGLAGKSGLGKLSGVLRGGGLIGSLMNLMILGVETEQRLGAEKGEMKNAAEAAGGIFSEAGEKGIDWMADFAEEAQNKFGITRKEIQSIVKQLANIGIKIDDKLTGDKRNWKNVFNNVVTSTLALDKFLNLASGSSMQNSIGLMENLGYSHEKAAKQVLQVGVAAHKSGMNMQKFIDTVHSGSAALVQYQMDSKDVAQILIGIKGYYEDLGIDPKKAGSMAAQMTTEFAQNMSNLKPWVEFALGQALFPGKSDFDAKYALKDLVLGGESDRKMVAKEYVKLMYTKTEGIQGQARKRAAIQKIFGTSPQLAKIVVENPDFAEGKFKDTDLKKVDELVKAFETEGETKTKLEKAQYDVMMGLSKIGKGLLKIISSLAGVLVIGFRSFPSMFKALSLMLSPSKKDRDQADLLFKTTQFHMNKQVAIAKSGLGDIIDDGIPQLAKGGLDTMFAVFDGLKEALNADFKYTWTGVIKAITKKFDDLTSTIGKYMFQVDQVVRGLVTNSASQNLALLKGANINDERLNKMGKILSAIPLPATQIAGAIAKAGSMETYDQMTDRQQSEDYKKRTANAPKAAGGVAAGSIDNSDKKPILIQGQLLAGSIFSANDTANSVDRVK